MKDGQHVKFTGEGDQEPGLEAGDIIIVLEEKEHAVFQRHGQDLVMTMDITLVEALCGMTKTINTLDKRTLVVSLIPGESAFNKYMFSESVVLVEVLCASVLETISCFIMPSDVRDHAEVLLLVVLDQVPMSA